MDVVIRFDDTELRLDCANYEEGESGLVLLDENGERCGYAPYANLEYIGSGTEERLDADGDDADGEDEDEDGDEDGDEDEDDT